MSEYLEHFQCVCTRYLLGYILEFLERNAFIRKLDGTVAVNLTITLDRIPYKAINQLTYCSDNVIFHQKPKNCF